LDNSEQRTGDRPEETDEHRPPTLAVFLTTDTALRESALGVYSQMFTPQIDQLPRGEEHDGLVETEILATDDWNRAHFRDAMRVSQMLTGGVQAVDAAIKEDDRDDLSDFSGQMNYRLRSLFEFICAWRGRSLSGKLPACVPPMPEAETGESYLDELIDALIAEGMYSPAPGWVWNVSGKHGEYDEPRFTEKVAWLNEGYTVPKWTRFELCALESLTQFDVIGSCAECVAGILAERKTAIRFRDLAHQVADDGSMARAWEYLTQLGFDGQSTATRSEVLTRALQRLLATGGVETRASGKVSYWRLTPLQDET